MADNPADVSFRENSLKRQNKRLSQSKIVSGPISYNLYSLFLKYLVNREVPTELALNDSEIPIPASEYQAFENIAKDCGLERAFHAQRNDASTSVNNKRFTGLSSATASFSTAIQAESSNQSMTTDIDYCVEEKITFSTKGTAVLGDDDDIATGNMQFQKLENHIRNQGNIHDDDIPSIDSLPCVPNTDLSNNTKLAPNDSLPTSVTSKMYSNPIKTNKNLPEVNNAKLKKFLLWAKKMYVKVNSVVEGKDLQIVSLMSKKSNREIAPKESFEQIIEAVHNRRGQVGQNHLSISSTIAEIKKTYTFGYRDFGMTEELVRQTVSKCRSTKCIALYFQIATEKHIVPTDGGPASTINQNESPIIDKFYQEIAHIIVENDIWLHQGSHKNKEKVRSKINSIKRSSPFWHARVAKRKVEEERTGQSGNRARPSPPSNIVETMSLEAAYECLVQLTTQMRHELLIAFVGERRHQDNLSRSIAASQALVRRCLATSIAPVQIEASPS
ncbi:uncharacterized protein [Watersipora subatra]|uniref:uncharacterized protein n=1 Tax=Watersipora subatra TaxID=2589382 RepID=UPI00355AD08A